MTKGYTVSLMNDLGWTETCHPLAIGVDLATAKSIKRHFKKSCTYCDWTGLGSYVTIISREWCTNHAYFEVERNID